MEITWSGSAAGSVSFNPKAAAVGIRGTVGAVGIPRAEGIIDRVLREGRDETGLSRVSGLFGLSCWPDRQTNQRNQRDQTDQRDEQAAEADRWRTDSSPIDC
jgi:hypothetical protein